MKHWLEYTTTLLFLLLLCSCGSKTRQSELIINDNQPTVEVSSSDTTITSVQDGTDKAEEKQSAPLGSSTSSSSHSSSHYDNMRGFDPASEDDMDDNGMSRYMENDDEEGWD